MTSREFSGRLLLFLAALSVGTVALISSYLVAATRFSPLEWRGFLQSVAALFPFFFGGTMLMNQRLHAPLVAYLRAEESSERDSAGLHAAFHTLSSLPYWLFLSGLFWWTLGGLLVSTTMAIRFESFSNFEFAVVTLAASTGGFVSSVFMFYIAKRMFGGLRKELARRIGDPAVRQRLVRTISMRRKLVVSITGVTCVTVTFALFFSTIYEGASVERNAIRIQRRFLDLHASGIARGDELVPLGRRAAELGIADALVVIDPEALVVVGGPADGLTEFELLDIAAAAATAAAGDSASVISTHTYAWRALASGEIVVASQEWSSIAPGHQSSYRAAATLLFSTVLALLLSLQLARDAGESTMEIGASAERVASGDLRQHDVFEAEDELGMLARTFERMASALRRTVSGVVETADRVEATATETSEVGERMTAASRSLATGVAESARSMTSVTKHVAEISESALELNVRVEESSCSILEMSAAGSELAETATMLFAKVDEVSSSVEQSVRNMRVVGSNTELLAQAADDTSSSMEQMASAMRQISDAAVASSELSQRVVETAEHGRATVGETVANMQAIRRGTETAELVIRGLGERAQEIGGILDVIEDVADETNLLALNAAIIAAQAGDHGRAFSVVAEEIKELADRVLSSTKEIDALIRSVQLESANAIAAISQGAENVATGVSLSTEAGSSLEEITRVSRESGDLIGKIVTSVKDQTDASMYVVRLMESVKDGVEGIRRATTEQDRGSDLILRSTLGVREIAQQVHMTTGEQARAATRIQDTIEGVRTVVGAINTVLESQSASCGEVVVFLDELTARRDGDDESGRRMEEITKVLLEEASDLRENVGRFRV